MEFIYPRKRLGTTDERGWTQISKGYVNQTNHPADEWSNSRKFLISVHQCPFDSLFRTVSSSISLRSVVVLFFLFKVRRWFKEPHAL